MGHIALRREIEAPVERVFAYVDDHRNTVRYMRGLTLWSPTTEVVHGKDAEFEVVMKAGPANLHSVVRITTWTENRTIAWRSIEGFQQKGRWGFGPRGDHTEVTLDMEYEFGGGIAGRMLGKAAEPAVRHNLEQSVNALKEQTERLRPAVKRPPTKAGASEGQRTAPKAQASGNQRPTTRAASSDSERPTTRAASSGNQRPPTRGAASGNQRPATEPAASGAQRTAPKPRRPPKPA